MAGFKGHLRGGIICALLMIIFILSREGINARSILGCLLGGTMTMVGSLLPDIDHPQSFLGRRMKIISRPIYRLWGHRTITHSILMIGALGLLIDTLGNKYITLGIVLGMMGHVLLDLLCLGSGVAFLYPLYPKKINLISSKKYKKFRRKLKKIWKVL